MIGDHRFNLEKNTLVETESSNEPPIPHPQNIDPLVIYLRKHCKTLKQKNHHLDLSDV